jgi:hypothetical protein
LLSQCDTLPIHADVPTTTERGFANDLQLATGNNADRHQFAGELLVREMIDRAGLSRFELRLLFSHGSLIF